jgi:hypothetical protein
MLFATKEFLFLFWLFNFMVLSLARVVGYQLFYYVRSHGKNLRNLVIVGESADAVALGNRIGSILRGRLKATGIPSPIMVIGF